MPFRPLKTFPALGGRWGGKPQRSLPGSEGDTRAEPAGPIPTIPTTTFLRRAAGPSTSTPSRLPGRQPGRRSGEGWDRRTRSVHLALRAPSTRSGAAQASRFGPAAKGLSPIGPALACPLVAEHLGSSPRRDPSITGCRPRPAPPARPQVFTFRPATHAFAASAGPCGCGGAGGPGWSRRRGGAATLPTPGSPPRPAPS